MRIANVDGRAKLFVAGGDEVLDVSEASQGRFGPELPNVYDDWAQFRRWAATAMAAGAGASGFEPARTEPFDPARAGPPSPWPRQVFAVALNYVDHAAESGFSAPSSPLIFAKYVSAFSGPVTDVVLPEGKVDWECELVAVVSSRAHRIDEPEAWDHLAGVTIGQDISERVLQRSGPVPQFALGKSHPGFAPTGPLLVTPDELDDRDDLAIGCEVNGRTMQEGRTSDMIFPVAKLVAYLSTVVTLLPGDVIFTGTPPGVGAGRKPPVFLQTGDVLRSWIEGIGELRQRFVPTAA